MLRVLIYTCDECNKICIYNRLVSIFVALFYLNIYMHQKLSCRIKSSEKKENQISKKNYLNVNVLLNYFIK